MLPKAKFDYTTHPKTLLNFTQVFKFGITLGRGNFGYTSLVTVGNQKYALKIFYPNHTATQDFHREVENLILLSKSGCPPDIICYIDSFKISGQYCILSEYINGTTLESLVKSGVLPISQIKRIGVWLFKVLAWLHSRGFAHNDISTSNIMMTSTGLKLIDFGLSCRLESTRTNECTYKRLVNLEYQAPEMTTPLFASNPGKYSQTADIYAAGIVMVQLLHRRRDRCLDQLLSKVLISNPDRRISSLDAYNLIKSC